MSLTKKEIDDLRGLANRLGTSGAAEVLKVHKTSLIRVLAGEELRPNTEAVLRKALEDGVIDTTRSVGETKATQPTTRRRS